MHVVVFGLFFGFLDYHLDEWEKASAVENVRAGVDLKRTTGLLAKKTTEYKGVVLCMKPNFVRLRLEDAKEPKDYEAYISDGKRLYVYDGLAKTVTETALTSRLNSRDETMVILRPLLGRYVPT